MRDFAVTPEARGDLTDIWHYTARRWEEEQADRYIERIVTICGDLADGTKHGREMNVLRTGYFMYPVGSDMLFYRFTPDGLELVRVLHKRMDVTRHLPD